MAYPANLSEIIRHLYPAARPLVDYEVTSDGDGSRITRWDLAKLGPQPDEVAILSAKQFAEAAETNTATKIQQAIDTCKAYNPSTATAAEVRATLGTALVLLRRVFQELR